MKSLTNRSSFSQSLNKGRGNKFKSEQESDFSFSFFSFGTRSRNKKLVIPLLQPMVWFIALPPLQIEIVRSTVWRALGVHLQPRSSFCLETGTHRMTVLSLEIPVLIEYSTLCVREIKLITQYFSFEKQFINTASERCQLLLDSLLLISYHVSE